MDGRSAARRPPTAAVTTRRRPSPGPAVTAGVTTAVACRSALQPLVLPSRERPGATAIEMSAAEPAAAAAAAPDQRPEPEPEPVGAPVAAERVGENPIPVTLHNGGPAAEPDASPVSPASGLQAAMATGELSLADGRSPRKSHTTTARAALSFDNDDSPVDSTAVTPAAVGDETPPAASPPSAAAVVSSTAASALELAQRGRTTNKLVLAMTVMMFQCAFVCATFNCVSFNTRTNHWYQSALDSSEQVLHGAGTRSPARLTCRSG